MAGSRLLMRKLRDILRLRYEAGLKHRAIAQACAVGLGSGQILYSLHTRSESVDVCLC
jgi:hypothetical protein